MASGFVLSPASIWFNLGTKTFKYIIIVFLLIRYMENLLYFVQIPAELMIPDPGVVESQTVSLESLVSQPQIVRVSFGLNHVAGLVNYKIRQGLFGRFEEIVIPGRSSSQSLPVINVLSMESSNTSVMSWNVDWSTSIMAFWPSRLTT